MAVRYLIVKHLSLGFGVLVKRDNNNIGQIYFADMKSTKNVTLSHPSISVAENISLTKFVNLGLYEGLFSQDEKKRASDYFNNRIKNMHLSENECYGTIIGTHEYSFRIKIEADSSIYLSCTCPVDGVCKHLYAVFVNIKKLLDPKAAPIDYSSDNNSEFRDILERFLYLKGGDNTTVIAKLSYLIRSEEKFNAFINDAYSFYQRSQYKARVINDILAPLFFSSKHQEAFNKVLEKNDPNLTLMIEEAKAVFTSLNNEYERKKADARKANVYHILLSPDCMSLVALLKRAEDNYSEERIASQVMTEYLKYQDLTIEEICALKDCYLYQINHRYYINEILNGPAKNFLSTYLLFFDEIPIDEKKCRLIPLEYFLKVSRYSNDKSRYIQIVYMYFDQIKDEYPLLSELLVGVSLQHDYIDERTIRLSIELSKKIPHGTYINELVEKNIRRPKKAKA